MFSEEQVSYFKEYILLKNSGSDVARISSSLFDSKISLNPHQINAALAFFKNPKKKGMIFADEVGLGKTIEAGLVISQYWYEQKKHILIICPASLIKQWNEELMEKFHLDSVVLDGKKIKETSFSWEPGIYISSINTVYLNKEKFGVKFDLVVIDEAHKLRNVYKDKGVMAPAVKEVFNGQKKLLLTATPFQNNLQELFGLMSLIDEDIFPDFGVFKEKYIKSYAEYKDELNGIVSSYAVRTLRKDVKKYINYTKRNVLLANYQLTDDEKQIYQKIEALIYSQDMFAVYGTAQLHLIILLLQKLLSSSIYAVKSTLSNIMYRLKNGSSVDFIVDEDDEEENELNIKINIDASGKFVGDIQKCVDFIDSVDVDSKLQRLLTAISDIYEQFESDTSRNRKILIFTESKNTQEYLYNELSKYYEKILLFNGDNSGDQINDIYLKWAAVHNVDKKISKTIAVRRAIVDAFEKDFEIMIATDAAAEGLNLQFCSVMVNYDLPWNPQKIEQRIGRCHRYGQKNDVIVINLLNDSSNIDKRIYELLNGKLGIFEETFGSSDKILGSSNISENIEDAIRNIYKKCRTPEEIEKAFEELQNAFKEEIENAIKASENDLDTYFDEEVAKAFDFQYVEATRIVDEMSALFYCIIKYCLPNATFDDTKLIFTDNGVKRTVLAKYDDIAEFCSISSDYGQNILKQIKNPDDDEVSQIVLDYSNSGVKIGYLDGLSCKKGKLIVSKIIYDSFELSESLVLTGILDDGTIIPADVCHKILKLSCVKKGTSNGIDNLNLKQIHDQDVIKKTNDIAEYNAKVFKEELDFIDNWADSMIEKVQLSVKNMRDERKELQISCDLTSSVDEKTKIQEEIHKLSKKINKAWIELAQLEDEIEDKRLALINNLKAEKDKSVEVKKIFEVELSIE